MGRLRWLDNHRTGNPGVLLQSDKYFYIRDTGLYFRSSADGTLDFVADTELTLTSPTITLAASTAFSLTGDLTLTGALTVGVDDTGHDVKFFGATSGAYMLWDESGDELVFATGASIDITADKVMIDFKDGDASTIDPSATAESGWINVNVGGVKKYIPYYAAS